MAYHVTHIDGRMETGFPVERMATLLGELDACTREHPDVWRRGARCRGRMPLRAARQFTDW